jgi:hypothetical protein
VFVHVDMISFGAPHFIEIVHIELSKKGSNLPDKRREVLVFEVGGQHLLSQLSHALYGERIPILRPADYVLVFGVLSIYGRDTSSILASLSTNEDTLVWAFFFLKFPFIDFLKLIIII